MGFLYRTKRIGYDNIAVGSETGEERHVEGGRGTAANATSQYTERLGTTDAITSGQTSVGEKLVGGNSSDSAVDVPGSTSNTSLWTSNTSFVTDSFPERVG